MCQLVSQDLAGPGIAQRADDARGLRLDGLAAEIPPFEIRDEENREARLRREPPDEVHESVAVDPVTAGRDLFRRRVERLDVKLNVRLAEHVVGVQQGLVEAGAVLSRWHLAARRDALPVGLRPAANPDGLLDDLVLADDDRDRVDLERDADRHGSILPGGWRGSNGRCVLRSPTQETTLSSKALQALRVGSSAVSWPWIAPVRLLSSAP